MPELNDATLWDYMTGFYGTGHYSAPTWFIGIEEGGGEEIDEIIGRCGVWEGHGRPGLDDLFDFYTAVRPYQTPKRQKTPRLGPDATVAPTWRKLICLLFAIEGTFPNDKQERDHRVLDFQKNELARTGRQTSVLDLFPLPCPRQGYWVYGQHSRIPCLATKDRYHEHVGPLRVQGLKERVRVHKPKLVICYGKRHWGDFQKIAGVPFKEIVPTFELGHTGTTIFVRTDHPQQTSYDHLKAAGSVIAAALRGNALAQVRPSTETANTCAVE